MQKKTLFKSSERIELLVSSALPGFPFWDLCCDHGYIGVLAASKKVFPEIHFVDQVPHIIDRLIHNIETEEISSKKDLYFHKMPAEKLEQVVTGNLIIAGVGMRSIVSILENLIKNKILLAKRVILSPQSEEDFMASPHFPLRNNYQLSKTLPLIERTRKRQVFIWDLKN